MIKITDTQPTYTRRLRSKKNKESFSVTSSKETTTTETQASSFVQAPTALMGLQEVSKTFLSDADWLEYGRKLLNHLHDLQLAWLDGQDTHVTLLTLKGELDTVMDQPHNPEIQDMINSIQQRVAIELEKIK